MDVRGPEQALIPVSDHSQTIGQGHPQGSATQAYYHNRQRGAYAVHDRDQRLLESIHAVKKGQDAYTLLPHIKDAGVSCI